MAFLSGLRRGFLGAIDPARLAMSQSLLAGDYGAAAEMAQRFRLLQEEHERLRTDNKQNRVRTDRQRSRPRQGPIYGQSPAGLDASDRSRSLVEDLGQAIVDDAMMTPPFIAEERRQFEAGMRLKGVNGWGYVPRDGDQEALARALFSEAVGSPADMPAIAAAILNRVRPPGRPEAGRYENEPTLAQVLRIPGQYPFMPRSGRRGSPKYELYAHPERMTAEQRRARAEAQRVAALALAGKLSDPTGGSTSYYATHEYDGRPETMPEDYFRGRLEAGTLRASRYRSSYPRRPGDSSPERRPTHFFGDPEDFPVKR